LGNSKCRIYFSGYYQVAYAAELLGRYHIDSRITRAPVNLKNSCSFVLMIPAEDLETSRIIFEREKMSVNKIEYV